jgi:hypothetical protein
MPTTAKKIKPPVITEAMVDEFAAIRDQLKSLTAREKVLKEAFRANGAGIYAGEFNQIEIVFTSRPQVNMDEVRDTLGAEWIEKHSRDVEVMNVRQMELV